MIGSPRIKELFNDLIELPDDTRRAYLLEHCGDDAALRERLETLLCAYETADGMLSDPTHGAPALAGVLACGSAVGQHIGPYQLLERIGEGGFGTVYLAEQREPVQRRVALKLIKPGMDSRQVIARFEAERAALARMDHPHIARVLDAGTTDARSALGPGRPYFVMELVKGVPITHYCDEHELPLRERLELFADACRGVQHAHQKGVIHRDLKPSNVLVSRFDERPVVKIIDFGIAKATTGRLTEKTLFTELRQMIGTPAYMSPEQAGLSDLDVDTRSDIYSLSVLLYELLTGMTPFDVERLRSADFDELQRIIREEEPPKPSTRISAWKPMPPVPSGGDQHAVERTSSSQEIAQRRSTDPRSLVRSLHGELDWIVMKGLEKDRARRYETCDAMALDVERYLRHEPVLASPPSRLYRLRKLVRRNRATVAAGTMVCVALLAGIAGTSIGLVRAEERRAEAEGAREREKAQRELAEGREQETLQVAYFQDTMLSKIDIEAMGRGIKEHFREQVRTALSQEHVGQLSERRLRTPEEVKAEMAAFDQRAGSAQAVDVARSVLDEFLLSRAADALEQQFADQPLVRAQLRFALGRTYRDLGLHRAAEPHLRAALEIRRQVYGGDQAHVRVAEALYNLAGLLADDGRLGEAETHYGDALAMWRELEDEQLVVMTLNALAGTLLNNGRLADAELLYDEALPRAIEYGGEEHSMVVTILGGWAVLLFKKGQHDDAEELMHRVLEMRRREYGPRHPYVATSLSSLALIVMETGRHEEAEGLLNDALDILRAQHGDEHPLIAKTLTNLGKTVAALGRPREAERLYREALQQQRKLLELHRDLRFTLEELARLRQQEGDHDEAIELFREELEVAERAYPEGSPESWRRFAAMVDLGGALAVQARALLPTDRGRALALWEEAAPLFSTGCSGMKFRQNYPVSAAENARRKRESMERAIELLEFWDSVVPGRGWGAQAAAWKADLEKLSGS